MAASLSFYQQADTGNLNEYISNKIRSARDTAAQERKYADDRIKELEDVPEGKRNQDQIVELDFLKQKRKERYFTKALGSEFGGDFKRRVAGSFKKNPDATQDPALTKEERFSALVRGGVQAATPRRDTTQDTEPPEPPKKTSTGDPNTDALVAVVKAVRSGNRLLIAGINKLRSKQSKEVEVQDNQNQSISVFKTFVDSVNSYFKRDNNLEKQSNDIKAQQLELFTDAQDDLEMDKIEVMGEGRREAAGLDFNDKEKEKEKEQTGQKNLLSSLADALGDRKKNRGGGLLGALSRFGKRRKGPLGAISAAGGMIQGAQDMKNFSQGGYVKDRPMKKYSEGKTIPPGIYDSPKTGLIEPGAGVVPLNRNNPIADVFEATEKMTGGQQQKQLGDALHVVTQAPTMAAGALALSTTVEAIKGAGGLAPIIAPMIKNTFMPLAQAFGLPSNIIQSIIGGEAKDASGGVNLDKLVKPNKTTLSTTLPPAPQNTSPGNPGADPYVDTGLGAKTNVTGGTNFSASSITRGMGVRDGVGSGKSAAGHTGIDLAGREGTPLSVTVPGTVVDVETDVAKSGGYGKFVTIKLDDGKYVKLAHLKEVNVGRGQRVGVPDQSGKLPMIGRLGNTGLSTGPHLHVDLGEGYNAASAQMSTYLNPQTFIMEGGVQKGGQLTPVSPVSPSSGDTSTPQQVSMTGGNNPAQVQSVLNSDLVAGGASIIPLNIPAATDPAVDRTDPEQTIVSASTPNGLLYDNNLGGLYRGTGLLT